MLVASERCCLRGVVDALKGNGPVIYLSRRDIRADDNWSLLLCFQEKRSVRVVHILENEHPTYRLAWFYYKGLEYFFTDLKALNVPLDILYENSELSNYLEEVNASGLVADLNTLREFNLKTVIDTCDNLSIPIWEVDSHNIVPVWVASDKQEYGARTIRSKINSKLSQWLKDIPITPANKEPLDPVGQVFKADELLKKTWGKYDKPEFLSIMPGGKFGKASLEKFIHSISDFEKHRNNPTKDSLSGLSPWFRHGHLSKQRVALEVKRSKSAHAASYLEELIVRGELAENYTFYNENYDNLKGGPAFGVKTLQDHAEDKRDYLYTIEQFEKGETHDELWNAAQYQLVYGGKMHGFMRMYWAKKILEWTDSPEKALETAINLNDKFSLDGRDPRGYVGIMWSITGLHDQGWKERAIFGKVRYMNYDGCRRKFDVDEYVRQQSCLKIKGTKL